MGRRKALAVVTLIMLFLSFSTPVIANEDGKFNSSNGCTCHSSSSTSTTPTHNFPSSYTPSTSYSIQIGLTGGGQDNNLLYLSGVPHSKVPSSKIIDQVVNLVEERLKNKS